MRTIRIRQREYGQHLKTNSGSLHYHSKTKRSSSTFRRNHLLRGRDSKARPYGTGYNYLAFLLFLSWWQAQHFFSAYSKLTLLTNNMRPTSRAHWINSKQQYCKRILTTYRICSSMITCGHPSQAMKLQYSHARERLQRYRGWIQNVKHAD